MSLAAATDKHCAHCGDLFHPWNSTQRVCGPVCARKFVAANKKAEKAADKVRAAKLEKPSKLRAKAQAAFNKFIRARDADLPCVSCGTTNPPMRHGGAWDAGHFLGRGAYPELAFDEDNCHKQCKSCNAGSGKFSHKERTVREKYEVEILKRIGAERLEALKGPHSPKKYTEDEYRAIEATYKAKKKELEGTKA